MKIEKLLSIGSVVLLKEANKRIMIIGYYPTLLENDKEITYDYCGCIFPEGVMDSSKTMLFNHNDIDKLFYYGLMDEEQNDFMARLEEAVNEEAINTQNTQSQIVQNQETANLSINDVNNNTQLDNLNNISEN